MVKRETVPCLVSVILFISLSQEYHVFMIGEEVRGTNPIDCNVKLNHILMQCHLQAHCYVT